MRLSRGSPYDTRSVCGADGQKEAFRGAEGDGGEKVVESFSTSPAVFENGPGQYLPSSGCEHDLEWLAEQALGLSDSAALLAYVRHLIEMEAGDFRLFSGFLFGFAERFRHSSYGCPWEASVPLLRLSLNSVGQ